MQLRIQQPDGQQQQVTLEPGMSLRLGTHQQADIVLRGAGVFPIHAGIVHRSKHYHVVASKRARTVRVNGTAVPSAVLHPGDQIEIGQVRLEVVANAPPAGELDLAALPSLDDLGDLSAAGLPPLDGETGPLAASPNAPQPLDRSQATVAEPAENCEELPADAVLDSTWDGDVTASLTTPVDSGARAAAGPSRVGRVLQSAWFKGGLLCAVLVPLCILIILYIQQLPTAEQRFQEADRLYQAGNWQQAIDAFDQFLTWHRRSQLADAARVEQDLARLQLALTHGADADQMLDRTAEVLESWGSRVTLTPAQDGLAEILPTLVADLAQEGKSSAQAGAPGAAKKAFGQATQALDWICRYLPPPLQRARNVDQLQIHLTRLQREFNQQSILRDAVDHMEQAGRAGGLTAAYEPLDALLVEYPELATNGQLSAVLRSLAATEAERCTVTTATAEPDPNTPPESAWVTGLLDSRPASGTPAAGPVVPVLLREAGAVLALDAPTGRLLWRRQVGFPVDQPPREPGNGAQMLLVDAHAKRLVCLDSRSGNQRWVARVGAVVGQPAAAAGKILVANRAGHVTLRDSETGQAEWQAVLPQPPATSPVLDGDGDRCYVVADRGVVYVLSITTGRCLSVCYVGHNFDTITMPPVYQDGHLLVLEQAAPDFAKIHVYHTGDRLDPIQVLAIPANLAGVPVRVGGRLYVPSTDNAIQVLEWSANRSERPLILKSPLPAPVGASTDEHVYLAAADGRLWSAARGVCAWTSDRDGPAFTAGPRHWPSLQLTQPLYWNGNQCILAGYSARPAGLTVICWDARQQQTVWQRLIGVPAVALGLDGANPANLWTLTADGAVFCSKFADLPEPSQITGSGPAVIWSPIQEAPPPDPSDDSPRATVPSGRPVGPGVPVLAGDHVVRWVRYVDPASSGPPALHVARLATPLATRPAHILLPPQTADATPSSPPVTPPGPEHGLLGALVDGPLCLLAPRSGQLIDAFLPPQHIAQPHRWLQPVTLPDQRVLIGDSQGQLWLIRVTPDRTLECVADAPLDACILCGLATTGRTAWAVDRDLRLVAIHLPELQVTRGPRLAGTVQWGPQTVGTHVFVATSAGQLCCLGDNDEPAWTATPSLGPIVGVCDSNDNMLSFATAAGKLGRLDRVSGRVSDAVLALDQPLTGGPVRWGPYLIVTTRDGAVLAVPDSLPASAARPATTTAK